jgi:hypothetical protein
MKIENGKYPPNYKQIVAAIPEVAKNPNIIFTYGSTLYVPNRSPIPFHLKAHEETHVSEQLMMGVDNWWAEYLLNPRFRLEQELLAYRAQYQAMRKKHSPRYQIESVLLKISADLSGEMYGDIVPDRLTARELITGESEL